MRADCRLIVSRLALLAALEAERAHPVRLMRSDAARLAPARAGLRVETAALVSTLEAEGTWARIVEAPRPALAGIIARLKGATVELIYSGHMLSVGTVLIEAREDPAAEAFRSPERGEARPLLDLAADDLRHAARRPLRSNRMQKPAEGLPLFNDGSR